MTKGTLLDQVQRSIRDLVPLAEHPKATQPQHCIAAADQSIVLHSAHSLVRELEVLHDHLLTLLAAPPAAGQAPLQPRNIIVMLPDDCSGRTRPFAPCLACTRTTIRAVSPLPLPTWPPRPTAPWSWPCNGCCACRSSAAISAIWPACWTCPPWPPAWGWSRPMPPSCATGWREQASAGG